MAPHYVCAECEIEMRPKTNCVYVIEMATFGPYKVWEADLWRCPNCGHETIAGFALEPLAEHYEDRFQEILKTAKHSGRCYYAYQHSVKEEIEREAQPFREGGIDGVPMVR
jgi:hypothetical protein